MQKYGCSLISLRSGTPSLSLPVLVFILVIKGAIANTCYIEFFILIIIGAHFLLTTYDVDTLQIVS